MTTPVAIEACSKYYGEVLGISDVTLTFKGGIVGLLGPNGAGKSTLMKLVAGLLRPSRGKVTIHGASTWEDPAARRRIGYCPEHEGTYEELSGLEMVTVMAELAGVPRRDAGKRARAALADVGLTDAMNRRLQGYSKGMRQRAKLAQALVHDPDVLLLDEPLTGCDPLARQAIVTRIKALGDEGKTILMSSHVLYEIEALTREVVVIHRGQVLAEGNIYKLRDLIDEHPHRVRVETGIEPGGARALAQRIIALEHIARVEVDETALEIETRLPDRLYDELPGLARAAGVKIQSLTSPDNNIAAVFEYLTQRRT